MCGVFALATKLSANSWIAEPLEKVPSADNVFAFANRPPLPEIVQVPPLPKERKISREDLASFLREGERHYVLPPEFLNLPADINNYCEGVFFTKEGHAYFWTLSNGRILHIATLAFGSYRTTSLVLREKRVKAEEAPRREDEYEALEAPSAESVKSFTNDDLPGTGTPVSRDKHFLVEFLSRGKVHHYKDFAGKMRIEDRAKLTVPKEVLKRVGPPELRNGVLQGSPRHFDIHIRGAFATKEGKVYFWEQWGDTLLHLSDSGAGECVLELPSAKRKAK